MSNYNLLFYAKKTKGNHALTTIYLRITVYGKRAEISTGQTIETPLWNPSAGKVSGTTKHAKVINSYLDSMRLKVLQCWQELHTTGTPITSEMLKNKFLGIDVKRVTIVEVFKDHNQQMKELIGKSFAHGTWERYETSLRHTISFLQWKYKVKDIEAREINSAFVSNYEFWLRSVQKCSNNTTVKYMKNFQKIINICLANEWIAKNPFSNYKSKLIPVTPDFLTEEQLETLRNKSFRTERLSTVRDIFLFSCYTGLAYIDIFKLTKDAITIGLDGSRWIKINRTKTKIEASIPILPITENLLEKYSNHPKCLNENKLLPILSNQKMNEYLKEISELCQLGKDITFHTARHTFATSVTLNNGVPLETVSKMLGHSNIKMTQHYAKVLDRKISEDMKLLQTLLQQKEDKKKKLG